MDNKVLHILDSRRSHRAYTQQALSREELDALVYAGISSPSANNHQPWHFSVVQDQHLLDAIHQEACKNVSLLPEAARSARFADPDFHIFYHAPAVIFISAPEQPRKLLDCGIAVQSIAIAAQSLGLGSVILGLPREAFVEEDKAPLEQALQFPEGYEYVIAIAIGTPDDEKKPHEMDKAKVSYIR